MTKSTKLIGKQAILQLEDGRIPTSILSSADCQGFDSLHKLLGELTIHNIVENSFYGESLHNNEVFSFEEIFYINRYGERKFYFFPSSYFQIAMQNHPLTTIFSD